MVMSLVKPVLAGLIFVASGPPLPNIDVRRTCAEAASGDNPQSCVDEELYAKKKLIKYWNRTPLAFKQQCLSSAQPPAPSYIVLRDCINNNIMVQKGPGR